jgi:hypothetical protein
VASDKTMGRRERLERKSAFRVLEELFNKFTTDNL